MTLNIQLKARVDTLRVLWGKISLPHTTHTAIDLYKKLETILTLVQAKIT